MLTLRLDPKNSMCVLMQVSGLDCKASDIAESIVVRQLEVNRKDTFLGRRGCVGLSTLPTIRQEDFDLLQLCQNLTECVFGSNVTNLLAQLADSSTPTCLKTCGQSFYSIRVNLKTGANGRKKVARATIAVSEDNFCELGLNREYPFPYGCAREVEIPPGSIRMSRDLFDLRLRFSLQDLQACTGPFYQRDCPNRPQDNPCVPRISYPGPAGFGNFSIEGDLNAVPIEEENFLTGKDLVVDLTYKCNGQSLQRPMDDQFLNFARAVHDLPNLVSGEGCRVGNLVEARVNGELASRQLGVSYLRYCESDSA
jgi:hypothetical protein